MTAHPYILARTMRDAHMYARGILGLEHGKYRVVTHASTIKSVRNADLFLVPGFETRFDRFAIKGALRWTRMNVLRYPEGVSVRDLEVAYRYNRLRGDRQPDFIVRAVSDDTVPPQSHTDLVARVKPDPQYKRPVTVSVPAEDFAGEPDELNPPGEQLTLDRTTVFQAMSDELEDEPEAEPEKPVKRRRRRCNECGTLHFKNDPCPSEPLPGV